MPVVLNIRTATVEQLKNAVRVDRQTPWGNPHHVGYCYGCGVRHDRTEAILLFKRGLESKPDLVAAAKIYLKGKDLVCWCTPQDCHGDVWLEVANEP